LLPAVAARFCGGARALLPLRWGWRGGGGVVVVGGGGFGLGALLLQRRRLLVEVGQLGLHLSDVRVVRIARFLGDLVLCSC
jgi:hypothetical protein